MGEARAVPRLIESLKDPDAMVLGKRLLQPHGDPQAIGPLIETLNDVKESVRMAAMATLCSLGEPSIEPLIHALIDPNEDICHRATLALVTIGEPAVDTLIKALGDQNPGIPRVL